MQNVKLNLIRFFFSLDLIYYYSNQQKYTLRITVFTIIQLECQTLRLWKSKSYHHCSYLDKKKNTYSGDNMLESFYWYRFLLCRESWHSCHWASAPIDCLPYFIHLGWIIYFLAYNQLLQFWQILVIFHIINIIIYSIE